MDYRIKGQYLSKGFTLHKGDQKIFATQFMPWRFRTSRVNIGEDKITIKSANFIGDKFKIIKNDHLIGELDLSNYRYDTITLTRGNGGQDTFQIEELGYTQIYILSSPEHGLLRFTASINPLRVESYFDVEILTHLYPQPVLEELIFYAGEILFRMFSPNTGSGF